MNPYKVISTIVLAAAGAASAATPNSQGGDELLRQMSAKLAAAKSFTFQATREIDPALLDGRKVAEKARVSVSVQRPGKLVGRATSKEGVRRFIADGRALTLVDEKANHYAIVPMRTTIDGLVEKLEAEYGFTPPLAEFALSNPYADFRRQAQTVTYLGRAKVAGGFLGLGGEECHRIGLKGRRADAELWVGVGDQLPRKLVATFHQPGNPQVRIQFSKWNLSAPASAADFQFTPPPGAQKIEVWTTARMQAATRKP